MSFEQSNAIEFDLSLIHQLTKEDGAHWQPVSVTRFKKANKELFYLNAHHGTGSDFVNKTFLVTRLAFYTLSLKFAVLEYDETQRDQIVTLAREHEKSDFFQASEPIFAAHLAMEKQIPFKGGEPSDRYMFSEMEKHGYSPDDIIGLHFLTAIRQMQRDGSFDEDQLSEYARYIFTQKRQAAGITHGNGMNSLEEFEQWYAAYNTTGKHYSKISDFDVAPVKTTETSYFRDINRALGLIREPHIDTVIEESLSMHDSVLVVYGGGHLTQSRPVFEKAFGPGTVLKLT